MSVNGVQRRLERYKTIFHLRLRENLQALGEKTVESARKNLLENDSYDTGELYDSVYSRLEDDGFTVKVVVGASAKHAEFVEYGTGIRNERGNGRKTPWKFQDKDGKWYTMTGAHPYPFLRPAIAEHAPEVKEAIKEAHAYALAHCGD